MLKEISYLAVGIRVAFSAGDIEPMARKTDYIRNFKIRGIRDCTLKILLLKKKNMYEIEWNTMLTEKTFILSQLKLIINRTFLFSVVYSQQVPNLENRNKKSIMKLFLCFSMSLTE